MTEYQIERRVELEFDRLDRKLMNGKLRQEEYDEAVKRIYDWAETVARTASSRQ